MKQRNNILKDISEEEQVGNFAIWGKRTLFSHGNQDGVPTDEYTKKIENKVLKKATMYECLIWWKITWHISEEIKYNS